MLFVYAAVCAGCGFHSADGGDGSASADDMAASGDLAGAGGDMPAGGGDDLTGVPPGSDLAHGMGGSCAPPLLLVGVENLHNPASGGGRVARLRLSASAATACTTLSGQGLIAPQPLAVAMSADGVAAATRDGVYLVDPRTDTIKWSKPAPQQSTWLPLDAFSFLTPTGTPLIAVAYGPANNPPSISEIDAFDGTGGQQPSATMPWCVQGVNCTQLPLSLSILSVSATPTDLTHFVALDAANNVAAWDVNPWSNPPSKTQYVGTYTEPLASLSSTVASGKARFAWLDGTNAIQYVVDSGSGPSTLAGPIKCASGCTTMLHVVPDPTTPDGFFILCDGATVDARTVVRMDGARNCTTILDGKTFGAESRLSRLGLF